MSANVPTASSVSTNLISVPSSGAKQRPKSSLGQRLVPASSTATLMWIISAGTHTTSRPTSSPRWNSTKSVSACSYERFRSTSSTLERRIESISRHATSTVTTIRLASHQKKKTMSMRRTREGLSVRGTGLSHVWNLQEGLPGKRHPGKLNDTTDTWIGACFFAKK